MVVKQHIMRIIFPDFVAKILISGLSEDPFED
jgi:hypothetical protein